MTQIMTRDPIIIATEINHIKDQTRKILLTNSVEIGKRLVEAKQMVSHGEWGKWLEESVDYSQRTANNLMKLYEEYGNGILIGDGSKSQALATLSYTQAVALLGIPEDQRVQFIEDNNIEDMSTRELQQLIKEKQNIERQLQETKKMAVESQELAEKERFENERLLKGIKKIETEKKNQHELVKKLKSELKYAKENDELERVEELTISLKNNEKELNEAQNKIKDLEQKLKEKPIDVPAVIEKIPEEIEKELEELRLKVSNRNSEKSITKFTYHFESLVNEFRELLNTLTEIEDVEITLKYKNAVKGLINKMNEEL